jgi:hypothetical protein
MRMLRVLAAPSASAGVIVPRLTAAARMLAVRDFAFMGHSCVVCRMREKTGIDE